MITKPKSIVGLFSKKFSLILFFLFFLIVAIFLAAFVWWQWALTAVNPSAKGDQVFVVKRGEGLVSIAGRLRTEGLVKNSWAFRIFVLSKGLTNKIQAGTFRLTPAESAEQITQELTHGTLDIWLTFPEGWRKEEYGQRLAANLSDFDYSEFLALTKDLEGRLFPDTYLIPLTASPSATIRILKSNFEKKTADLSVSREQLVVASIVEREARQPEDMAIVAGILLKRWRQEWPLQVDATIQYAAANARCGSRASQCDWWAPVTGADLEINSSYNTYKHKGLPPGPICNPGLNAIKAVLNSQETDYWYYLSDSQGVIHYAKTDEEHQANVAKYLR